jgi:hypothetical protein
MGWIRCLRCEKFGRDLVARICALMTEFVLICTKVHLVTKQSETLQYMSLGPMGVYLVRSLRKIPTRHRWMDFCINDTSSARFAPKFVVAEPT